MALTHHLAQVNIARMLHPREDSRMAGFFNRLEEINALAESSPGFIWRLKDSSGNATYIRPYDDDRILFNLTVWESVEALAQFTYRTAHKELIGARKQWFEQSEAPFLALWWIAAGHEPTVEEAKERLDYLRANGATPFAFGFKSVFPPPSVERSLEAGSGSW